MVQVPHCIAIPGTVFRCWARRQGEPPSWQRIGFPPFFVNTEEYPRPGAKLVNLHTQGCVGAGSGSGNRVTSLVDSGHLENQNMNSRGAGE